MDSAWIDADRDGWPADEDCLDEDPDVHPGAQETCDGVDQDCDGLVDEDAADAVVWYADEDGDGFGDPARTELACAPTEATWVTDAGDCEDTLPAVNPAADEVCDNGLDDDCDGGDGSCRLLGSLEVADADFELYAEDLQELVAGDLNDDGQMDIVGVYREDDGYPYWIEGTDHGGDWIFVVFGPADSSLDLFETAALIEGRYPDEDLDGTSPFVHPDLSGDGVSDLLMASRGVDTSTVYVAEGGGGIDGTGLGDSGIQLTLGDGQQGRLGLTMAAPDLDGDGSAELFVVSDGLLHSGDGEAFVVSAPLSGSVQLGADQRWWQGDGGLGGAVSASGDVDQDGYDDLLFGAPNTETDVGSGVTYLYYGGLSASRRSGVEREVRFESAALGSFGSSVADPADLSGDGRPDVVVGAAYSTPDQGLMGAAYVFDGPFSGGVIGTDEAFATIQGVETLEHFGLGISVGDVDGDGGADLFGSALGHTVDDIEIGRASLFYGPLVAGSWTSDDGDLLVLGDSAQDGYSFGRESLLADITGDGKDDLLVGGSQSSFHDESPWNRSIFVFEGRGE
jgi:hypothetical protein